MALSPDRSEAIFEPFESEEPFRYQSLGEFGEVEPGPIVPSGDTRGAAIPELPAHSYVATRGAATLDDRLAQIEALKQAELARVQREHEARVRVAEEVRPRHHVKTLGARRRAHRGLSRARRPGPCRTSGSRRARSTSRARARSPGSLSGDPDEAEHHHLAAGAS